MKRNIYFVVLGKLVSSFHILNLLYEEIRIQYFDINTNKQRTYIVDFYDEKGGILYELKPISKHGEALRKFEIANTYATMNNLQFIIIDETTILNYIDEQKIISSNNVSVLQQYYKVLKNAKKIN
jgi:hypothetical protein